MNLIYLSPGAVYPPNTGARVVAYNQIKGLAELGHNIHLITVVASEDEAYEQTVGLSNILSSVWSYNRSNHKLNSAMKSFIYPFVAASRSSNEVKKNIEQILKSTKIDAIILQSPHMLNNIKNIKFSYDVKCILSLHNIEYKTMYDISKIIKNPLKKFAYVVDSKRLEHFEKTNYKNKLLDGYFFVSEIDKKFFDNNLNYRRKPTFLVPIGAEAHSKFKRKPHNGKNVLIVGKMSYYPNIEGVLWFYKKVWKKLKAMVPEIKLYIVGRDPDAEIRNINDPSVIVTGTVDSVEEYYSIADAVAIPIFSGGGVKTKLIEAASYGIPIVSTDEGIKGTEFRNYEHLFVANDPNQFLNYVCEIINADDNILDMEKRCQCLFFEKYSWDKICRDMSEYLYYISK